MRSKFENFDFLRGCQISVLVPKKISYTFKPKVNPVEIARRVHIAQGGGLVKLRRVRFCAFDFDNWGIALVLLVIVLMEPL